MYGEECPHDRDPETCEGTVQHAASKCPSSVTPHAIRRGSITYSLNNDMPDKVVSARANVSPRMIEQHYDRLTKRDEIKTAEEGFLYKCRTAVCQILTVTQRDGRCRI